MCRSDLDHAPRIHDSHAVGDLREKSEIVRDIEHRHTEAAAEGGQQFDDLLLRGHVEAGGRFVEDDQFGLAGERHGDADPLLLTS